mmetsp:Transcript_51934/g.62442  ORF Transcript_51934/g.62442 Transcript_51934/m.62442 type:complete len:137 (-) Transcript_51934:186-596(-)|eukprot:CAMPEP_0172501864 /NCGR_PEP_ID=MMETSP1066-20121228/154522_1 /TAXON_ID=671091 /ORGANISM="Coscinodiscus wailesii, Strain CCMP2513" /LENGTH=136 /DNA_ID=CAMNT_0013276899 /DNA_START=207 /DNA_END=617 /DNA_ORIENTATION=-
MTVPLPASPKPSQSLTTIILKVLFVMIILLLLPQFVTSRGASARRRRKLAKKYNTIKWDCEHGRTCARLLPEERMSCVSNCVSEECHDTVYGANPLEDGEVDFRMDRLFENCVKADLKEAAKRERRERAALLAKRD